jgi:hypothetical protein
MKMRNVGMLLAAGALALLPLQAAAADKVADSTIKGEILDMGCYLTHEGQGADHAGCAVKCVKEGGQPMGLKGTDGKVYVLLADHGDSSAFTKAKDLAGKNVEITGAVAAKDGINAITVHGVKAL